MKRLRRLLVIVALVMVGMWLLMPRMGPSIAPGSTLVLELSGQYVEMAEPALLPRLVGVAYASELLFTGRLIRGSEALRVGLVTHAEEADEVLPTAMQLARAIAGSAPQAVQQMKASIRRGLRWEIREAALEEAGLQAASLATEDAKEGVAAILEKREPEFAGK